MGSCEANCSQFILMLELADMIKVTTPNQTEVVQMVLCVFSVLDFKIQKDFASFFQEAKSALTYLQSAF